MSDLAKLVRLRGRIKGSLTRALSFAKNASECTVYDAQSRLHRLDSLWAEFVASTDKMYEFIDEEGYLDPGEDYADYEEIYYTACGLYTAIIARVAPPQAEQPNLDDSISRLVEQQTENK